MLVEDGQKDMSRRMKTEGKTTAKLLLQSVSCSERKPCSSADGSQKQKFTRNWTKLTKHLK